MRSLSFLNSSLRICVLWRYWDGWIILGSPVLPCTRVITYLEYTSTEYLVTLRLLRPNIKSRNINYRLQANVSATVTPSTFWTEPRHGLRLGSSQESATTTVEFQNFDHNNTNVDGHNIFGIRAAKRINTQTGNYTLANNNKHVGGKMEFIERLRWRHPPFRAAGASLVDLCGAY